VKCLLELNFTAPCTGFQAPVKLSLFDAMEVGKEAEKRILALRSIPAVGAGFRETRNQGRLTAKYT
jgi:hypothetical protein